MDDVTTRVRQIFQFPFKAALAATDAIVVQQQGVGGPFAYTNVAGLLPQLLGQLQTSNLIVKNLSADRAQFGDMAVRHMLLGGQAVLTQPNFEHWLRTEARKNFVTSFNGRIDGVRLSFDDVMTALRPRDPGEDIDAEDERLATTRWVQVLVYCKLNALLMEHPFVFSFNGRVGEVLLEDRDINRALLRIGAKGYAQTPPLWDISRRIATTQFVDRALDDRKGRVVFQPIAPAMPEPGTLWWDTEESRLLLWDGSGWVLTAGGSWGGIVLKGSKPTHADLPHDPTFGDMWITEDTGLAWVWNGMAWVQADFRGPQGEQGQRGPDGVPGARGPQGDRGPSGPAGPIGPAGTPGVTAIGAVPPASPVNGRLWWNNDDGALSIFYQGPSGAQWVAAVPGTVGPQGPPGLTGPQGIQGIPGAQGVPGPQGTGLILRGNVATVAALPTTGNQVGDMWITRDTHLLYAWDGVAWNLAVIPGGVIEEDAPEDGRLYGRRNGTWVSVVDDGVY